MNLVWSYGEPGARISLIVGVLGTFSNFLLGGWDLALKLLCYMMVMDFLLGILAAAKQGKIDSKVMFWGGVNKLLVLAFVALGQRLDGALALEEPYIRTAVIWFYCGREGLSLVENYGKLGGPVPEFLSKLLSQIGEKSQIGKE